MAMKAYHIATSEEAYRSILRDGVLKPGKNASDKRKLSHISLERPVPGSDLINYYVNGGFEERWILEIEVPDGLTLEDDPATEEGFEGIWKAYDGELPVKVLSVEHVRDLQKWNRREFGPYPEREAEDGLFTSKQEQDLFPKGTRPKFR